MTRFLTQSRPLSLMPDMYYIKNERPCLTTFSNKEKEDEKYQAQRRLFIYFLKSFGLFGKAINRCLLFNDLRIRLHSSNPQRPVSDTFENFFPSHCRLLPPSNESSEPAVLLRGVPKQPGRTSKLNSMRAPTSAFRKLSLPDEIDWDELLAN